MAIVEARPQTRAGIAFLALAGGLWGTGGLTGSLLARSTGLSPISVAAVRLGAGGLLLVAALLVTRQPLPRTFRAWRRISVIGLLAALFQASYFGAVQRTAVGLATLITIGASPLFVMLAEWVRGRRRPGAVTLAAGGLALCGLALLTGVPKNGSLEGVGFALLAAAGFAAVTLAGSRPVRELGDVAATGFAFTIGSVVLVALAGVPAFSVTPEALGLLVFLGLGPTAVAYASYFRGLRSAPASTAALLALLEPLVGTVLSVVLLGERLTPAGLLGAGLLAAALVVRASLRD